MAKSEMPQYAGWLEGFVKRLFEDPKTVKGIAVAIVGNDNTIETGYWDCTMADKILISGIIQQDAMLQTLAANADDDCEETDDDCEETEDGK